MFSVRFIPFKGNPRKTGTCVFTLIINVVLCSCGNNPDADIYLFVAGVFQFGYRLRGKFSGDGNVWGPDW